jgi:hypothetical protein
MRTPEREGAAGAVASGFPHALTVQRREEGQGLGGDLEQPLVDCA